MTAPVGLAGGAPAPTEGAGALSSWADLVAALSAERLDPVQVGLGATAAGLDTLGAALHPFDELLRAGFGWLVEHVDFLREPLDALTGDPDAVRAQAAGWHAVGAELRAVAADYRSVREVPGWTGGAAVAHRAALDQLAGALEEQAVQAGALSRLVLATGAAVGTARALVRDALADFASALLQYLLAGGALAAVSGGGSLAALLLTVLVRAQEVARWIGERIRLLLELLGQASAAAARIGAAMRAAAERVGAAAPTVRAQADALDRAAERVYLDVALEAGSQLAAADPDRPAEGR